jgi:TolA-binding protein
MFRNESISALGRNRLIRHSTLSEEMKMKRFMALPLSLLLVTSLFAAPAPQATGTNKKPAKKRVPASTVTKDITDLKQALDAQQQQIQQLRQDLQTRDQAIQQLQQRLDQSQAATSEAQGKADAAAAQAAKQEEAVTALKGDVADIKQNSTNTALTLQETQKSVSSLESPVSIHYKGILLTPGGFLSADTVYRRTALGSDISTPLSSIPYAGAAQSNLSEFFASGRASRISLLAEGKLAKAKLTGYYEADFLSSAITSNSNSTNSYSLRQRQAYAQATLDNGWSFTGGQMWSLVTETKNGVDNRSEAPPLTIDTSYNVGFSFARQYGFRVAKDFSNKFWLAFSAENAQTTVGGEGSRNNFLIGSAGTSGGAYNPSVTYSFNKLPDFIAKAVYQPGTLHLEVFGLVSTFRDRLYPGATNTTPTAAGAYNDTSIGKGLGANARVSLAQKHLDLGIHFLGGLGIGRYGTSGLADVFVRPDGVLVPIRSYQALGTVEFHTKRLDLYFNGGGEYAGRNSLSATSAIGYGSPLRTASGCYTETVPGTATAGQFPTSTIGFLPGALANCNVDTRDLIEGTFGFWYRVYVGPKGRIQLGPQLSYVVRNGWTGVGGNPSGDEPMVFTSFRYYLP